MSVHINGPLRIGQFAAACGVSTRTIRFYEERGLLPRAERQDRGMRTYSPELIDRVDRIQQLQSLLDWSLDDIRTVLVMEDRLQALRDQYYRSVSATDRQKLLDEAIALTETQLARVAQRLIGLQSLRRELEDKLHKYRDLDISANKEGAPQ